ncbi:hypothetical protein CHS0354_033035 [Potamilus streckersoni]|uniref:Uncharacterized protein n=1 Tax=Potamilus streckersoni TaxID=2493646 RepID=A0AAE0RXF3_9BIVA|nr:hypothetical protein CHS0354_033035 [Potamilus streckersoni]
MPESPDPEIQFCLNRDDKGRIDVIDDDQCQYDERGSSQIHSDEKETIYMGQNQNHSHYAICEANHFFRNCPIFIKSKSLTTSGLDDGKNKASSQGKESSSSTYNQGNNKPLVSIGMGSAGSNRSKTSIALEKPNVRTRHFVESISQWDNGFYTNGMIDESHFPH